MSDSFIPKSRVEYFKEIAEANPQSYERVINEYKKILLKQRFSRMEEAKINDLKYKLNAWKTSDNTKDNTNKLFNSIREDFESKKDSKDSQDNKTANDIIERIFGTSNEGTAQASAQQPQYGGTDSKSNIVSVLNAIIGNALEKIKGKQGFREKVAEELNSILLNPKQEGGEYFVPDEKYRQRDLETLRNEYHRIKNNQYFYDADIQGFDVLMFVLTTYIIQQVSILFVKWAIDTEYIRTFHSALILYIVIYIILFTLIIGLVNIDYGFHDTFSPLPGVFYYFFVKTNGVFRVVFHMAFMCTMMIIPFIITSVNNGSIYIGKYVLLDLQSKRDLYKIMSKFSLMVWAVCSAMAIIIR